MWSELFSGYSSSDVLIYDEIEFVSEALVLEASHVLEPMIKKLSCPMSTVFLFCFYY